MPARRRNNHRDRIVGHLRQRQQACAHVTRHVLGHRTGNQNGARFEQMLVDLDRRLALGFFLVVIVEAGRHRGRIVFHAQD